MKTLMFALVAIFATIFVWGRVNSARISDRFAELQTNQSWKLPSWLHKRIERMLHDAAIDIDPEQAIQLWAICWVGITMLCFALSPTLGMVTGVALLFGPFVGLRMLRGRANAQVVAALPEALDLMSSEMRAGLNIHQVIDNAAQRDGPLAMDLVQVHQALELHESFSDAMHRWIRFRNHQDVQAAAGSLALAWELGGPMAGALSGLASSLRDRHNAMAEAVAMSAQARLSAMVVGGAPLLFLGFSLLTDSASSQVLFTTSIGRIALFLGLSMDALALFWMRRISQSVAA